MNVLIHILAIFVLVWGCTYGLRNWTVGLVSIVKYGEPSVQHPLGNTLDYVFLLGLIFLCIIDYPVWIIDWLQTYNLESTRTC